LKSESFGAIGVAGTGNRCDGKNGKPHILPVPPGTVFRNLEREVVCELTNAGSFFIAAKGGAGGRGNTAFKSSTNQAPKVSEAGGKGENFTYDVGKFDI
jgi:GTP-binding protein